MSYPVYIPPSTTGDVTLSYLESYYPTYTFLADTVGAYAPLSGASFSGAISGPTGAFNGVTGTNGSFSNITCSGITGSTGSFNNIIISNSFNAGRGTVTQATSITTGVSIDYSSGIITTVSSTLASASNATFTVTNSQISSSSVVIANIVNYSGTGVPHVVVGSIGSGSFDITIYNIGSSAFDAALEIGFIAC